MRWGKGLLGQLEAGGRAAGRQGGKGKRACAQEMSKRVKPMNQSSDLARY